MDGAPVAGCLARLTSPRGRNGEKELMSYLRLANLTRVTEDVSQCMVCGDYVPCDQPCHAGCCPDCWQVQCECLDDDAAAEDRRAFEGERSQIAAAHGE